MMLFKRDGYYHVEYFDQNTKKLRRKSLKTKNKNEALKKLSEFENSFNHAQKYIDITLIKFADEYRQYIRTAGTIKYFASVDLTLRKLIVSMKTDTLLTDLTRAIMEKYLLDIFRKSKYAAHLYYRTLKAAMNKAIMWDYIKVNPIKGIKLPKIPVKLPAFISEKQLELIVSSVTEKDIKNIILVAFYTGMRLSEILNLHWDAVNLNSGIITVKNSEHFTTKNKKERIIPIHDKIKETLIIRYKHDSNLYVFSKNGFPYKQEYISHKFKKTIRKLGLPDELHFHSLRHSFASNLVQKGISLYVVKELLGHESITTTQIYSHLQQESLKEAISIL